MNDTELVTKLKNVLDVPEEATADQVIERANEAIGALLLMDDLIGMLTAGGGPASLMLFSTTSRSEWQAVFTNGARPCPPGCADDPINALHELIQHHRIQERA